MKKKNGFTLVELLAVIVVLAIIMIIAIPAVLDIMTNAKKQAFVEAIDKYVTAVQTQYMADSGMGQIPGAGYYVYNIQTDLGLSTTGNYQGFVVVDATNADNIEYYTFLRDNNFMIVKWPIMGSKMPTKDNVSNYAANTWAGVSTATKACQNVSGSTNACMNRNGYYLT
jgi:prepilin-type N-terminal cleavage/methylation domain-containing protein